jgi:hypothetical protein
MGPPRTSAIMKPRHSKREFLLNRIDGLNQRVQSLVSASCLDQGDSSLEDEVAIGLQALRTVKTKHHQSHQRQEKFKGSIYPKLVEDTLLLIVEAISPRVDLENFLTSNDVTTLKSMRL